LGEEVNDEATVVSDCACDLFAFFGGEEVGGRISAGFEVGLPTCKGRVKGSL